MEKSTPGALKKIEHYLHRYALPKTILSETPSDNLAISVVIPSFNEPKLLKTLDSLHECHRRNAATEVLVVINYPEKASKEIIAKSQNDYRDVLDWSKTNNTNSLRFFPILEKDIPVKIAGPGMARKIGMDESIRRFHAIKNNKGIIASLDADTIVEPNYLECIAAHWESHPDCNGVSIFFEHPLEGDFEDKVYDGIIDYELHLRYYINAQRYCGFPFAYQTVGSSFAVSAEAYARQGGMNRRKAGEDFYFIQKIVPLGNYYNINSTTIIPSSRPSNRVPFGTGRTITDFLKNEMDTLSTYNFQSFVDLKIFLSSWKTFFNCEENVYHQKMDSFPESIRSFLEANNFKEELSKITGNTSNLQSFKKAFFHWFNAFRLMKYIHFSRDHFHPNVEANKAVQDYFHATGGPPDKNMSNKDYLLWFRKMDRQLDQVK